MKLFFLKRKCLLLLWQNTKQPTKKNRKLYCFFEQTNQNQMSHKKNIFRKSENSQNKKMKNHNQRINVVFVLFFVSSVRVKYLCNYDIKTNINQEYQYYSTLTHINLTASQSISHIAFYHNQLFC